MWVAFFIYPYFYTKIWENRKEMPISKIVWDMKWPLIVAVIFIGLTILYMGGPLVLLAPAVPLLFVIPYRYFKKRKAFERYEQISFGQWLINAAPIVVSSVTLAYLMMYLTQNNTSPPLIILGAILPFIVIPIFRSIRKKKQAKV